TVMGGGSRFPHDSSQMYFVSNSIQLAKLAIVNIPQAIKAVLQKTGWRVEDVTLVVPHQVTYQLTERISRISGIPFEKCMVTVTKYGNTAAASIPIALAEAVETGRVKQGDKVLLVGGAAGWSTAVMAVVL
ncbi:MAG TPA: 3-oxoacyl-[acyl-carrier-protein] synthase III C-terminal domain-containing protein, partial [Dehalococcoidia bacterium]|nr:3-oxoacyl-[acyl-carrier-protein] synthase III C-terminal domain-containing protein [Dehalococcoidia bacterium]